MSRRLEGGSHVVPNIMLHPEPWQRDKLETRFHMALQAYNRVRDEWLKRRRKYFQHDLYHKARQLDDDDRRQSAFGAAMEAVGFYGPDSNGQISANDKNELFGGPTSRTSWCSDIAYHLPSEVLRRIGGMAAQAVMHFHREEDWGKPSPKQEPPPLVACGSTVELREDDGVVRVGGPQGGADSMLIEVDVGYLDHPKIRESLSHRKTYSKAMICRDMIGGSHEYKCKVTCEGNAPLSPSTEVREGTVGVDVGPSMVAAVSDAGTVLTPIVDKSFIDEYMDELDRIGRKLDRQRRANNPDKFDDRGCVVGSSESWMVSNRQAETYARQNEAYRKMLEERKRQHYELIKQLLELGHQFIVEDNSYRGWQAGLFGSSIGDAAPATFVDRLEERAKAAGGRVERVSTWDTKLSSRCHCGRTQTKDLSERWHDCACGVSAQRDLYSAFLARFCAGGELDADLARERWSELEPALQSASRESEVAKLDLEKVG
ncbi:MAG: zinc ribbon domain-containing protein [Bradymonadaceae bacterium]